MKNIKFFILILIFLGIFLTCENPEEPDTTPPVVSIQSPLSGETVSEIVTIIVSTSDNEEIEKVEFIIDDSLHFIDFQAPYEYSWNTSTLSDNSQHTVKVISYDTSNNSTESQPILLTINNSNSYPTSIDIVSILFENGSLILTWNKSLDGDFDSYILEKSLQSTMEEYDIIYTTNGITDTTYTDDDINPLAYQYYRIAVKDTVGLEVKGQIVSSSLDPVPTQVNVISVSYSLEEMTVIWEESQDDDFRNYKLLYSETESGEKDTLVTYTDKSITSHIITDFNPTHENWFWIIVADTLGQSTIGNGLSNEVDMNPTQIDITSVTYDLYQMVVQWNQSSDDDFISYELLYSETEYGSQIILTTITDNVVTSYILTDFDPTYENWFWIKTTDYWHLTTIGNGKSNSIDNSPTHIDVVSVTYNHNDITVNWNESPDYDFESYEVLYSETQFGNKTLLTTINNKSTTSISYPITIYDPTLENWFWIKVTDYWGLNTMGEGMSNQIEVPPTQSELNPIFYYDNSFHLSWPQNNDGDFLSYDLYESMSEDMTGENMIFSTNDRNIVDYIVSGINDDELMYYRLVVNDTWGFSTQSSIRIGSSYQKIIYRVIAGEDGEDVAIYMMNPDGTDQINLISGFEYYDSPMWSPNGLEIFYYHHNDNDYGLSKMNLDGTGQTLIANFALGNPNLSPDGTIITFTSSFEEINTEIYTINTDGSNLTRLTNNSDPDNYPKWSPDGSKIIFWRNGDIFIINSDGSGLTNLTNSPEYENQPSFSPDGSKISFLLWSVQDSDIYTMNIDGSDIVNVTNYTSSKSNPTWSPNGQIILYEEWVDENNKQDLFRINFDGTNIMNLTNSLGSEYHPIWFDNGSIIFYVKSDYDESNNDIYVMNPDGSNITNLTNTSWFELTPQFQPRQ